MVLRALSYFTEFHNYISTSMVTITLDDQAYAVPIDLTLEQWSQIVKWDFADPIHWPRIVHIATGIGIHILSQAKEDGLELAVVFIANLMNKRTPIEHINFNDITFGQWIDLDVYVAQGIDKSIKDVMDLLAPKVTNASEAMYVIDKYNHFRSFILRQYKELFDFTEGAPEEPQEAPDWQETARSWYRIIVDLAGDDLLKLDAVTDEPLKKALNFMALRKQKALEEQMRQRQQKKQYELQANR